MHRGIHFIGIVAVWTGLLGAQQWRFEDASRMAGIAFRVTAGTPQKKLLVETMTGGVCVLDADGDGWPDLYFASGTTVEEWKSGSASGGRLYRNKGDGSFADVTSRSGIRPGAWGMGCVSADFDNDGDTDLYLTNYGPNQLFRNNGNGIFSEIGRAAGVADAGWSTGAAFGDYDRDGDLDLYVANYVEFDVDNPAGDPRYCNFRGVTVACGPRGLPAAADHLYRNDGGTFTDVSVSSGIASADKAYGFQVMWSDLDGDGDLDIFVANDSRPNFFWRNDGRGNFQEEALFNGLAYNREGREQACMGVDIGDLNGDGHLDIYSTNFSDDYHVYYRNSGQDFFQDATFKVKLAEVTFRYLGFGALIADFNNDGFPDIFAANGHIYPEVERFNLGSNYKQPNQLFVGAASGPYRDAGPTLDAGFALVRSSRGAAWLDYDRDGDLDLAISNLDDRVDLLRNDLPGGGAWSQIRLRGRDSNRDGIGAQVRLKVGERQYLQELHSGASYLSDNEMLLHFGLGTATRIDLLEVVWPSGKKQSFATVPINTRFLIDEQSGLSDLKLR